MEFASRTNAALTDSNLPPAAIAVIAISVLLSLLTTTIFTLSICAQRSLGNHLHRDTAFISLALLAALALATLTIYWAAIGALGRPLDSPLLVTSIDNSLRLAHQLLSAASIQLARAGLLFLYLRIFPTRGIRNAVYAMLALTAAYFALFAIVMGALLARAPVNRSNALDVRAWYITTAAVPVALDVATLCLPLTVVWRLEGLKGRQKAGLAACFGLGGVCVFASAARLHYFAALGVTKSPEEGRGVVYHLVVWSTVESFTCVIAACLPTCATLLNGVGRRRGEEVRNSLAERQSRKGAGLGSKKMSFGSPVS